MAVRPTHQAPSTRDRGDEHAVDRPRAAPLFCDECAIDSHGSARPSGSAFHVTDTGMYQI